MEEAVGSWVGVLEARGKEVGVLEVIGNGVGAVEAIRRRVGVLEVIGNGVGVVHVRTHTIGVLEVTGNWVVVAVADDTAMSLLYKQDQVKSQITGILQAHVELNTRVYGSQRQLR